jgi:hypothetical protein
MRRGTESSQPLKIRNTAGALALIGRDRMRIGRSYLMTNIDCVSIAVG